MGLSFAFARGSVVHSSHLLILVAALGTAGCHEASSPNLLPAAEGAQDSKGPAATKPARSPQAPSERPGQAAGQTSADDAVVVRPPAPRVDEAKAREVGLRRIAGKHLTLYTDVAADPEVDALPQVFDRAVPLWCRYFGIDPKTQANWHVAGFLMKDKAMFADNGFLPVDLPPFKNGYAQGGQVWLYEQPTPYYRRHLLLHEGTHSFMDHALGSCGPPWYMEGMAELLATHDLSGEMLELPYFPAHKDEVPMWGRIRIVQDAWAKQRALNLPMILSYNSRAHLDNEPYGWCWAATAFFDGHPRYRDRFRTLKEFITKPDFNDRFKQLFAADWAHITDEWQVYESQLEYGYDLERAAIEFVPGKPLTQPTTVKVRADRGWQGTGLRLKAGRSYQVVATGRYQLVERPKVWWCEPNGVTIRYYGGRPLGMLLGAIRPDAEMPMGASPFLNPIPIGLGGTIKAEQTGDLYLSINDSPAERRDNSGEAEVEIRPQTP